MFGDSPVAVEAETPNWLSHVPRLFPDRELLPFAPSLLPVVVWVGPCRLGVLDW